MIFLKFFKIFSCKNLLIFIRYGNIEYARECDTHNEYCEVIFWRSVISPKTFSPKSLTVIKPKNRYMLVVVGEIWAKCRAIGRNDPFL